MEQSELTWAERRQSYWALEGRETAVSQLVGTCAFALIAQFAFIGLDRWVFPSNFMLFVSMRLTVNVLLALVWLSWRHRWPNACQIGVAAAVAVEILVMIYFSGGADSLYFAGLIIVLVGTPVLQPISVRGAMIISLICVVGFVAAAFGSGAEVETQAFGIQMVFILCAALESAFSCNALTVNRTVAFEQRREIEVARDSLASLDEAKNRFSANVHHELRTPLTLILAPLDALRGGEFGHLSGAVSETLRMMHMNGQRLLKLINNLLDLAKLESDRFSINRTSEDVFLIAKDVVDGATPMADTKEISLSVDTLSQIPRVNVDRDAVEKVIVNLVGNALKFTEPGGSVRVEFLFDQDSNGIEMRVVDSGVGLEESDVSRIFDRFAQVDASATREYEGTGIGLSLVQELVELHGGSVWAESEGVGEGTTVFVRLPEGAPDTEVSESPIIELDESGVGGDLGANRHQGSGFGSSDIELDVSRSVERWSSQQPGRDVDQGVIGLTGRPVAVVADDNSDMRDLLSFLLGSELDVCLARNGREALELVRYHKPDLVVTDIMMPEMSGTELCRAIKEDESLKSTPVMLVSSKAENEMKVEGLELGADDYVTKPFHPRELMARARGLVRVRVLQREVESRNFELEDALSDLKAAEVRLVQSERLAAVGELAAGVAHEVNNPVNFALNAVRAMAREVMVVQSAAQAIGAGAPCDSISETSQEGGAAPAGREPVVNSGDVREASAAIGELIEIISEGLNRTNRLVGDLRDFASPDRVEKVSVDVFAGVRSTALLLGPTVRAVGGNLSLNLPEGSPKTYGDPSAINQILLNLLKNASDAIEQGGGQIEISAELFPHSVRIDVSDDGPGLQASSEELFEPFFSTKPAGKGTGLGLPISRQIAIDHDGELSAKPREGGGATFSLLLPLSGTNLELASECLSDGEVAAF